MKIRTDFVTNSSSSCGIEIVIDNPVLLEMLARYKVMGLFKEENDVFDIISIGSYFDSGNGYAQFKPDPNLHSLTPALHIVCDYWWRIETLEECLSELICILERMSGDYLIDEDLLEQFKEELEQRDDEIKRAFNTVYWVFEEYLWGSACRFREGGASQRWQFYYDKVNGESLEYEQDGDDDDFVNDW